ncbi:hypothetical protein OMW55_10825 [Sphingomonas sp. BN140010]|uniref:Uncharacterized protein n=1 Tax=Sphingomonas arvum TaxID=2992113 RepID=A0ABT3JHT0_9SPHN|nr:hypothetical protein [Sphingomonas sp. BN140010]MCW3798295.1 hypothetical protein [Sphingomonas sp. BN140010]
MDQNSSSSSSTGTRDSTYDVVSVLYHALKGADTCQTYLSDANTEQQLRQFFEQAMQMQRQLADQAKMLLHDQLMKGGQGGTSSSSGGSAFSQFGSSGGSAMGGSGGSSMSGSQSSMNDDSMQRMGSQNDREGGSAYTSGESVGAQGNDPSMGQFGQSPMGGGQRHNEMSTGGGGTSSF